MIREDKRNGRIDARPPTPSVDHMHSANATSLFPGSNHLREDGMGVRACVRTEGVFATDSDGVGGGVQQVGVEHERQRRRGVGPLSSTVCSHGVGLEFAPLSPLPLPSSNVIAVIVASPAASAFE